MAQTKASSSRTQIGFFKNKALTPTLAFCSTVPTNRIFSAHIRAEPSKSGTSGPSISIRALSTPIPAKEANKCSTVRTLASPCLN